jgi:hypothetical protein
MRGPGLLLVLLLTACAAAPRPPQEPIGGPAGLPDCAALPAAYPEHGAARSRCLRPWTLLVYMAADNDLAPYAHLNLAEVEALPEGSDVAELPDLIVQLDTPGDAEPRRRLHLRPAGWRLDVQPEELPRLSAADLRSPVVMQLSGPEPADLAQDLKDFLVWGMRAYPARHYLVAVWGHGQGYGPPRAPGAPPWTGEWTGGIAFDRTPGTYLGIPDLRDALAAAEREALSGRRVDVYLSDACLMQSVEVAAELFGVADYIAGSTHIEKEIGMSYADLLRRLAQPEPVPACSGRPDAEACAAAHAIPAVYASSFAADLRRRFAPTARDTLTLSVLRSSEVGLLLPALAGFGRGVVDFLSERDPVHRILLRGVLQRPDPNPAAMTTTFLGNARDIGGFLTALSAGLTRTPQGTPRPETPASAALLRSIADLRGRLSRTVIAARLGTRYPTELDLRVLSVWLPISQRTYLAERQRFAGSALHQHGRQEGAQMGPWAEWIDRIWR